MPTATLYRVRVEVGGTVMIDDRGADTLQAIEYQTKAMKHSIAHEIYGDVHTTLYEMYPLLAELKTQLDAEAKDRADAARFDSEL